MSAVSLRFLLSCFQFTYLAAALCISSALPVHNISAGALALGQVTVNELYELMNSPHKQI